MIQDIVQTPHGYRANIDGNTWDIPFGHRFFALVEAAIAAGAEVTVEAIPDPVPQVVSRFQAKAALAQAGLLAQADAAVAASGNAVLQLAWSEANEFHRNSPGINALAPALGLDSAGLDDLFRAAAGIVA
jgi:hypothetical protein